jgi:hypothetical protein
MESTNVVSFDIGINNLSWCVVGFRDARLNVVQWRIVDLDELGYDGSVNKLFQNVTTVVTCLDENMHVAALESPMPLVVEAQPFIWKNNFANLEAVVRNISMSHVIQSFFLKNDRDKKIPNRPIAWVSPQHKLGVTIQKNRTSRKLESVPECVHWLDHFGADPQWKQMLMSHTKRDDLADSMRQALYYLIYEHPSNECKRKSCDVEVRRRLRAKVETAPMHFDWRKVQKMQKNATATSKFDSADALALAQSVLSTTVFKLGVTIVTKDDLQKLLDRDFVVVKTLVLHCVGKYANEELFTEGQHLNLSTMRFFPKTVAIGGSDMVECFFSKKTIKNDEDTVAIYVPAGAIVKGFVASRPQRLYFVAASATMVWIYPHLVGIARKISNNAKK